MSQPQEFTRKAADPDSWRIGGSTGAPETQESVSDEAYHEAMETVVLSPTHISILDNALSIAALMPSDLQFVKDHDALQQAFRELNATDPNRDWHLQKPILARIVRLVEEGLE